ncbi:hypothetical protein KBD08_01050 [Candidatus Babeliales bacterium]|nr:hypothetical protein [Candidatus Babeliales bacterium]
MKLIHYIYGFLLLGNATVHGNMIRDMSLMMGAQEGASIANQTVTSTYSEISQGLQSSQSNLSLASSSFLQTVQQSQQQSLGSMFNLFSSASKFMQNMQQTQQSNFAHMQQYIDSIVSLQIQPSQYVVDPVTADQQFAKATMLTPKGPLWKNIFQVGNWQYDENTNSFWQMQLVPCATAQQAAQNSIWTEWITRKPYEITCDITLYKTQSPFFIGIIFNKARWISGNSYDLDQYRTIGLYNSAPASPIKCYFAQQKIEKSNSTNTTTINSPLEQIFNAQGLLSIPLNTTLFVNQPSQPFIIHVKIKPYPDYVACKIWTESMPEPKEYVKISVALPKGTKKSSTPSTQASTDSLFLYHGIGFISAGAVAEFSLKSPEQLLFHSSDISQFKTDIEKYIAQQQQQKATSVITSSVLSNA